MRRFSVGMLCALSLAGCKTLDAVDAGSRVKAILPTPEDGIPGVLEKAPLVLEKGKDAVVSLDVKKGAPSDDAVLHLQRIFLQIEPEKESDKAKCSRKLIGAVFEELIEKDVKSPKEMVVPGVFHKQTQNMKVTQVLGKGWILTMDSSHNIKDLHLKFADGESVTCLVSAVGHGHFVDSGASNWGIGSGDPERDRNVRAWGASRAHRLWHYLWHGMRSTWIVMSESDRAAMIKHFGPSVAPPIRSEQGSPDGEDFLYMHHNMLLALKQYLASKNKEMVPAWKQVPRFGDSNYPSTMDAGDQNLFDEWEKAFVDESRVKGMTLGEYGQQIEDTIHNGMHVRFANPNGVMPPGDPLDPAWMSRYAATFDHPASDSLLSTYSSHVNPVFFMLHGWVDDRIQTWLKANGFARIGTKDECKGDPACYVWLSDKRYHSSINRTPWEGIVPQRTLGASLHADHDGHGLHLQGAIPTGPVPGLSAQGRALLYRTRQMGGFKNL